MAFFRNIGNCKPGWLLLRESHMYILQYEEFGDNIDPENYTALVPSAL